MPLQLRHELIGADDGACHQLGKEAEVETEIAYVLDNLGCASFKVDKVADGLECEERQPDGRDYVF